MSIESKLGNRARKVNLHRTTRKNLPLRRILVPTTQASSLVTSTFLLPSNQLLGVPARLLGNFDTAEHARDLVDSLAVRESLNSGEGSAFLDFLLDDEVSVSDGGDLRQVGHADHLMVDCHLFEFFTNDFGDSPSNSRIHLIEEQCRNHARRQDQRFQREHQAREFPAGGDLCEGFHRFSRIRRKIELYLVHTSLGELFAANEKWRDIGLFIVGDEE